MPEYQDRRLIRDEIADQIDSSETPHGAYLISVYSIAGSLTLYH
jgi:hypothetical protein